VKAGKGNGIVEAGPGSGKTTVIEEAINRVPFDEMVLAVSFTRIIRDELRKRLEHLPNVTVHTLNSFGNACCKPLGWYKVNADKVRNIVKFDIFQLTRDGYTKENWKLFCQVAPAIEKLVGLAKAHLMFELKDFLSHWITLAETYDVQVPTDIEIGEFEGYLIMAFQLDQAKSKVIDYDDQVAIPLRRGLPIQQFDRVFVDEAQDLTPAQIELTRRALKRGGRALYVGDRKQAIYQFRGADSRAMDNITETMDCTPMPLSICYRCSQAVVREAQKVFPDIEAFEGSPEGSVSCIDENEFRKIAQPGDVVLCRTTAPVVQMCLWFIRNGIKAVVKGRDIGQNLKDLIVNLAGEQGPVEVLQDKLYQYLLQETEKNKRNNKEDKQIGLQDRVDTIDAIMQGCKTIEQVLKAFDKIFGDEDRSGVTLMTIHKAKGLEALRIFILRPDQMPHKMAKSPEAQAAEINLKFVAITRAQIDLFWVIATKDNSDFDGKLDEAVSDSGDSSYFD
jgi:DNA helicase-2/ATP-dependent DNA helicase PcrA